METSVVTYTVAVCPDGDCQKIVDAKLKEEKAKRMHVKSEQEKREAARREAMLQKKIAKAAKAVST